MRKRKGKPDRLTPGSRQWEERQAVNTHNSFTGFVVMMQMQLLAIERSRTVTKEAKDVAFEMLKLTHDLRAKLRTRAWPKTKENSSGTKT